MHHSRYQSGVQSITIEQGYMNKWEFDDDYLVKQYVCTTHGDVGFQLKC